MSQTNVGSAHPISSWKSGSLTKNLVVPCPQAGLSSGGRSVSVLILLLNSPKQLPLLQFHAHQVTS